jgi:protein subunit release factor B
MSDVDGTRREAALRALALDDTALLAECVEQFFNAGGPGGQHQNKAETAVRLSHPLTGVSVTATERRSQMMNRSEALDRLKRALAALTIVQAPRVATKVSRGQKRRRLDNKRRNAQKKRDRHGDGW